MALFNEKYSKQTIILCFAWTSACFLYYAVMLMLPTILSRNQSFSANFQYIFLIIISLVETVSFMISKILMDHPLYGRKRSIYLGFSIIFILSILILIFGENNRMVLITVFVGLKIFATICFMVKCQII